MVEFRLYSFLLIVLFVLSNINGVYGQDLSCDTELLCLESDSNGTIEKKEGLIVVNGKSAFVFNKNEKFDNCQLEVKFVLTKYPERSKDNPLFCLIPLKPIKTSKLRLFSNEAFIRVVELGIYEPGMPDYPDLTFESGKKVDVPNFARDANVRASSFFGDFTADKAVDGVVSYGSRWVSGDKPPHELIISMDEEETIGCIQMLTGVKSGNQWSNVAKKFKFQYWDNQQWVDVAGSRNAPDAGSIGLILGQDENGYYSLVHRKQKPNWLIRYHDQKNGRVTNLAEKSLPADMQEGEKYVLTTSALKKTLTLYLNKKLLISTKVDRPVRGCVGLLSDSASNSIEIETIKVQTLNSSEYCYAGNINIQLDGNNLPIDFVPEFESYDLQLPYAGAKQLTVDIAKAVDVQKVWINGKQNQTCKIKLSVCSDEVIDVKVQSESQKNEINYKIKINQMPPSDSFKLVYYDEFDENSLNGDEWYYRVGKRWQSVQSKDNVSVGNGLLKIALTFDEATKTYTTGGIISKDLFGYGYYETRAKLWKGHGWHSAFWQMGYDPNSLPGEDSPENNKIKINEIDCFESISPNGFSTNVHYHKPLKVPSPVVYKAKVAEGFHVYGWEWTPTCVRFFFDGKLIRQVAYPAPHAIQNVWLSCVAHSNASTDDIPGEILFDYFRYYKKDYGTEIPKNAIVLDIKHDGYFEKGEWENSEYAISHVYDNNTRISKQLNSVAGWDFSVEESGLFEVFTWNTYIWPDGPVTEVCYEVKNSQGVKKVSFNPMLCGQKWVSLGRYNFEANQAYKISVIGQQLPNHICTAMLVPVRTGRITTDNF